MESRECCSHCCDQSIVRKSDELREGCRAEHVVLEEPKASSARRHVPGCLKFRGTSEKAKQKEIASCYDKFALAKRLHAENLQHQPLPDRVDDSVFKNVHRERDAECRNRAHSPATREEDRFLGPALGCKKPKTRMDLAICWETPVDPVYEPHRATHIDGTEGGSAPAIFALIQHTPAPRNPELLVRSDAKDECHCASHEEDAKKDSKRSRCCYDCAERRSELPRIEKSSRSNSVPRVTERKCAACRGKQKAELERRERDPRLIRSAVGVALGLEKDRTTSQAERRSGLPPARTTVPRPRTPFARRAFCIDTLAPPFSVVSGCRDADYPEHWRLMSVYQQSYRNPQKRRARHF